METISFELDIGRTVPVVMDKFWAAERWPEVAPHVKNVEIHFSDDNVQVLSMTVQTGDRQDVFKTVRIRQPDGIFYFQPRPPALLRRHCGWWEMRPNGSRTVLVSRHELEIDLPAAERFLAQARVPVEGDEAVKAAVRELIRRNSYQTVLGVKRRLEEES